MQTLLKTLSGVIATVWNGITGVCGRLVGSRTMLLALIAIGIGAVTAVEPSRAAQAEQVGFFTYLAVMALGGGIVMQGGDLVKVAKAWAERPQTLTDAVITAVQAGQVGSPAFNAGTTKSPELPPEIVSLGGGS